jgi:hypothetical protein
VRRGRPWSTRRTGVGRDDQRGALVALGDHLQDELRGALGECEVAELVEDDELGAGVARDDAAELAAALGCLELVRESGEGGQAHAASLLAGEHREGDRQVCLACAAVAEEDDALAVIDPGALRERGDRGLGDLRVLIEAEVLHALGEREPGVDQPSVFAALSALGDLGFQERGEVRSRGLLVACGLRGEGAEACPDCGELKLAGVHVDLYELLRTYPITNGDQRITSDKSDSLVA